jgi:hypothetical protein
MIPSMTETEMYQILDFHRRCHEKYNIMNDYEDITAENDDIFSAVVEYVKSLGIGTELLDDKHIDNVGTILTKKV